MGFPLWALAKGLNLILKTLGYCEGFFFFEQNDVLADLQVKKILLTLAWRRAVMGRERNRGAVSCDWSHFPLETGGGQIALAS